MTTRLPPIIFGDAPPDAEASVVALAPDPTRLEVRVFGVRVRLDWVAASPVAIDPALVEDLSALGFRLHGASANAHEAIVHETLATIVERWTPQYALLEARCEHVLAASTAMATTFTLTVSASYTAPIPAEDDPPDA